MRFLKACPCEWLGLLFFLGGLYRASAMGSGANVDETRVQNVYHVDVASPDAANDDKHGTADAPFATISYGCEIATRDKDRNIGSKVVIAPGVYRETVEIRSPNGKAADTDAPLVIESAERGQAVIDGADTEGWTPSTWKADDTQWTHPWPFRRNPAQQAAWSHFLHTTGAPPSASGEAYRSGDLILVDGNIMRQVNRQDELGPGSFWGRAVSLPGRSTKSAASSGDTFDGPIVMLRPGPDTRLADSIIQIGVRDHGLAIHGRQNVVVRGLLFQHAADPAATNGTAVGLLIEGCSNVLVDDVLSEWNDGTGLQITGRTSAPWSTDFTVRQSHLLHNGGSGMAVGNVKNLLVEDTEACFNNFRGEWASWVDATGPAGVKTSGVHTSMWLRLRAVGNFCRGLWWDGDNTDVTLEDGELRGNLISGLCVEHDPGPVVVRRSVVADTKSPPGVREENAWQAGVSVVATPDLTLESNILAANAVTQLGVWEGSTHSEDINFENRAAKRSLRIERHAYHHNVFYGIDATQFLYSMPAPETAAKAGPSVYYNTLDSADNCFWNPALGEIFSVHGPTMKIGSIGVTGARTAINLDGWRTMISTSHPEKAPEINSMWRDPLFAEPSEGDYRLGENSPVTGWNLPSEEGASAP